MQTCEKTKTKNYKRPCKIRPSTVSPRFRLIEHRILERNVYTTIYIHVSIKVLQNITECNYANFRYLYFSTSSPLEFFLGNVSSDIVLFNV